MKKRSTIFLVVMLIISSLIFLYPTISNYWNSLHQTSVIQSYEETTQEIVETNYDDIFLQAKEYNETLASLPIAKFENGYPVDPYYDSLLKLSDYNVMGYITIDKIDVKLPIYHGTSESVLAVGTGHLEGSSLPIGGESTHSVITGHRGLASAVLFTHLNELKKGDIFTITVLSKTLTYKVDKLSIVSPEETDSLAIAKGKDYCTLVTCTPFGINTDRMLVRGVRIENIQEETLVDVKSEATLVDPMVVSIFIIVPLILIFVISIFCIPVRTKKQ